ncbi:class I tRNA ligase family protein [Klebsiella pneumoniae]|nr:class I tRNA ligase family protein [Klebsiella pneumoniae]
MQPKKAKTARADGPPYETNGIHIGHSGNKILERHYRRVQRTTGYDSALRSADRHGLPIEPKVSRTRQAARNLPRRRIPR